MSDFRRVCTRVSMIQVGAKDKSMAASKKLVVSLLVTLVKVHASSSAVSSANSAPDAEMEHVLTCLASVIPAEILTNSKAAEETAATDSVTVMAAAGAALPDKDEEEEDRDEEEDGDGDAEVSAAPPSKSKAKGSAKVWDWATDFFDLMKRRAGATKLAGDAPSTAPIGTPRLMQAVRDLSELVGLGSDGVSAALLLAKAKPKGGPVLGLSRRDDVAAITAQWDLVRAMVMRPDTVLVYHLKNHYALVFATREWVLPEDGDSTTALCGGTMAAGSDPAAAPRSVRQILTARKGQRPSSWIEFDDVREVRG